MSRLTDHDNAESRRAAVGFAQSLLFGLPEGEADAEIRRATSHARQLAVENGYTPDEQAELQHHFAEAAKDEWQRLSMAGGNAGRGFA